MPLSDVRTRFIDMTGRKDWETDYTLPDRFINDGQRFLDRIQPTEHSLVRINGALLPGDGAVVLDNVRSVHKVYLWNSDAERISLEKKMLDELLALYPGFIPPYIGDEKVTNGNFDTDPASDWTLGSGWSWDQYRLKKSSGVASSASQSITATDGDYRVVLTLKNITAGSVTISVGGKTTSSWSSDGIKTTELNNLSSITSISIDATSNFAGWVDNVSLREIVDPGKGDRGTPTYYAPNVIARPKDLDVSWYDGLQDWQHFVGGNFFGKRGFLVYPPADSVYSYSVLAEMFSPKLVNSTDYSYWTEQHPEVLALAAAYQYELYFRNMQGATMTLRMLKEQLLGVDADLAEEAAVDVNQLEG